MADLFRIYVISSNDIRSPINLIDNKYFFHIKYENVIIIGVSTSNPNACLVFEFLLKIVSLGKSYLGEFKESDIKNNFTVLYELFDGILEVDQKYAILDYLKRQKQTH